MSDEKGKEISAADQALPDKGAAAEKDFKGYDLLDDCRIMLRFAVKEGLEPDGSLRTDIATLDGVLNRANLEAISELPKKFLDLAPANPTPPPGAVAPAAEALPGATTALPNPVELAANNTEKTAEARKKLVDIKAAHATGNADAINKALGDLDNVLKK
jgi:hypothetical protein